MTALIIYLAVVAAAWILISRSVRRAPRDIELWHPWELLMDEKPALRAEVLNHYPEIAESWNAGDSPQQFLEKHPQIACNLYLAAVKAPKNQPETADIIPAQAPETSPKLFGNHGNGE